MKTKSSILSTLLLPLIACNPSLKERPKRGISDLVLPTAKQVEWAESKIGILIHFDTPTNVLEYNCRGFGSHPPVFSSNLVDLDRDQWLTKAKKLGAKYAVFVAKHCSTFSILPTQAHE